MKIEKRITKSKDIVDIILYLGLAYYGKRIFTKTDQPDRYQIGIGLRNNYFPTLFFNIENKPFIKNLLCLNILLFIPYVIYFIYRMCINSITFLSVGLYYCSIGYIKHGVDDFGWKKRYLIVPIIFWQVISIILIIKHYLL